MKKAANAQFAIKSWDETPYSEGPDLPKMTRASVAKTFTGDIEGESHNSVDLKATGRPLSATATITR